MKEVPECDQHLTPYAQFLGKLVPSHLKTLDVLKCAEPRAMELAAGKELSLGNYQEALEEFVRGLPLSDIDSKVLVTARANQLREGA